MSQLGTRIETDPKALLVYKGALPGLLRNSVWQLIASQMDYQLEVWRGELEQGSSDVATTERLKGGIQTLKGLLAIPQTIDEYEVAEDGSTPGHSIQIPTNRPVL